MPTRLSQSEIERLSVAELEAEIRRHNESYWDQQNPEISDYDYDRLVRALKEEDPTSVVLQEMGPSLVGRYGAQVEHSSPMLSLDKCYDDDTLENWLGKFEGDVLVMPKMDGVAASLRYDAEGRLALAATRGDGSVGDDITANAHTVADIPRKVGQGDLEIRGELYMRLSVFAGFGDQFSNPRNLTAGAIKSKDPERCRGYQLSFAAYDLLGTELPTEAAKMARLGELGFAPVDHRVVKRQLLREVYEQFATARDTLDYEIDGVVFRADVVTEQQRLGATAHHPRFAIAYKFQGDSATTVLENVSWSVARTGVITPVALIRPVTLSGASVSRASLHHAGFIDKLGLSLGAEVVVTRRGGVIPKVEWVAKPGSDPVRVPERCPSCAGTVSFRGDFLVCDAPGSCRSAILGTLAHYCSVVDIQGFGDKLLASVYDQGLLRSPADLYRLTRADLLSLERVGEKLADKLLTQVEEHRRLDLAVFLRALGIDELGKHVSEILAQRFAPLERVRQVTIEELAAVHSIGEVIAHKVVAGLAEQASLIESLMEQVTIGELPVTTGDASATAGPLAGKSFVFTGKLIEVDRKAAQKRVKQAGGLAPSGVTKDLDYLVVGDGKQEGRKSSKLAKAEKYIGEGASLRVISETDFLVMLASDH